MPTLAPATISASAAQIADQNWTRNRFALQDNQSVVSELLGAIDLDLEWVFARDGSVTALTRDGKWWGDCSVPLLTGRALLKRLDAKRAGSCLLLPGNAGLVIAARERVGPSIPLFVIQPDLQIARMILACDDFSNEIRAHRLWIASGADWALQFAGLFQANPGLATPVQFIRTRLTPEPMTAPVVSAAEKIFSDVVNERAPRIAQLAAQANAVDARNILLIGSGEFRLWDFGCSVLGQQLAEKSNLNVHRFDTDEPMNSSPLALLWAAQNCGSVVTADICRADSNQPVSKTIPWITWITQPVVPPFATAGSKDGLILADANWRQMAMQAGWPAHRVRICGWPVENSYEATPSRQLAMIVDTFATDVPASVKQFSSHRLLWELIDEELQTNPFAVQSADAYLTNRAGQLNITADAIDRRTFLRNLIWPAYQQGLARALIEAGVSLALWGQGWSELEAFKNHASGTIQNSDEYSAAVAYAAGLIFCWPNRYSHPIDATGRPVLQPGNDRVQFIRNAQRIVNENFRRPPASLTGKDALARAVMELLR